MTRKLFGTDGIRGVANADPMTGEMAMQLGRAIAHIFKDVKGRHRIVVGKDTRLSGYMLETALASGVCSMGADVMLVGPLPTPGIAFITTSMRANAGVVISASHNPYYDNGIKIFSQDGFKLPDEIEHRIEELILSNHLHSLRPTANAVGKAHRIDDAVGRYVVFLKNTFPNNLTLDGLRIALDCANGAAYRVAPTVLRGIGSRGDSNWGRSQWRKYQRPLRLALSGNGQSPCPGEGSRYRDRSRRRCGPNRLCGSKREGGGWRLYSGDLCSPDAIRKQAKKGNAGHYRNE